MVLRQVGGYTYYLARTMAVPVVLAMVLVFTRSRSLSKQAKLFWLSMVVCGLLALAGSGYRNGVAIVLLTGLVAYSYAVRRIKVRQMAVAVLGLLLFIGIYGFFRFQGSVAWDWTGI